MNFENDISQRALDSYDIARHDAVDALRKNFNIQSIYEYGTVKAPGISDLDLMIVMNAASAKHHALRSPSDILPDHVKSIAAGGAVMVLDEKLFSTINTWDEVQVKLLWGDQIKMAIGSYSSSDIHLARAIDWIPERILRLVQMPHMESVKTSRAIGLVYSLCHSLRLVIQEFNPESSAELSGFTNRVDALRDEWFNSDPPSRNNELAECIGAGAKLAIELIPLLASKLLKTGLEDLDVEGEFKLGRTGSLEFRRDHDYGAESLASDDAIALPTIFYEHFKTYSQSDGFIGARIRSAMNPSPTLGASDTGADYTQVLKARIDWIERHAKLLSSLGFTTGLYKFGWFYSPTTRGVD